MGTITVGRTFGPFTTAQKYRATFLSDENIWLEFTSLFMRSITIRLLLT